MISTFFGSMASRVAERWAAMSGPALTFWLGGFLAWARGHGGLHAAAKRLSAHSTPTQATAVLLALLVVACSALVVQRLTAPFLRLLEGYWPAWKWLTGVRESRIRRIETKADSDENQWQVLAGQVQNGVPATRAQVRDFARLDRRLRRRPQARSHYMPTGLGNILRASETTPQYKYGLDAVTVWPHLWLLLPDTARQDVQSARRSLDTAAAATLWGLLFCAFAPWTWFAIPVGLTVAAFATFMWIPARAKTFADLLEAVFDLYRTALYRQLRWPLPDNPSLEVTAGRRLTTYLQRGSTDTTPTFTPPP
ncbi:hypothetical protein [Streptomyces sp. NBC_00658]|uniref:hypothetical protein n=1 Tax=Streptomyces sp. NBC_00658 TaxID=2975800 RepID=UPI0032502D71